MRKHRRPHPPSRTSGFTLLELMATIAVLGVLLAIGVPSFQDTIRNNATAAQANEFVVALNTARSEARKRGLPVAVCAANSAQADCDGATTSDWANGWIMFLDQGGTAGAVDTGSGDSLLQVSRRVTGGLQLTSNNLGFVRFAPSGAPTNAAAIPIGTAAVTFGLQHQDCSGTNRRVIVIDRTGRVNLTKTTCT
ncbi:MAG: GspH/FimT family pseudopilin [Steroidobacteraceae bacterium]